VSVTVAPSSEACIALVDRINAGTAYSLDVAARYSRVEVSPLDEIDALQVDVVAVEETQLADTFAIEDRTSHKIAIWYRAKLADLEPETIDSHCLVVRQIFQRVNNWDSADGRVKVWETDEETRLNPDKEILNQHRVFSAVIVLRVEVEAS
jgi:hypothetical protein